MGKRTNKINNIKILLESSRKRKLTSLSIFSLNRRKIKVQLRRDKKEFITKVDSGTKSCEGTGNENKNKEFCEAL